MPLSPPLDPPDPRAAAANCSRFKMRVREREVSGYSQGLVRYKQRDNQTRTHIKGRDMSIQIETKTAPGTEAEAESGRKSKGRHRDMSMEATRIAVGRERWPTGQD